MKTTLAYYLRFLVVAVLVVAAFIAPQIAQAAPVILSPQNGETFSGQFIVRGEGTTTGSVVIEFQYGGKLGTTPGNWTTQKILGQEFTICSAQNWVNGLSTPLVLFGPGQWRMHVRNNDESNWSGWVNFNVAPVLNPSPPFIIAPGGDITKIDNAPLEYTVKVQVHNPDYDEVHYLLKSKFEWRANPQDTFQSVPIDMYNRSKSGDIVTGKVNLFKHGEWRFAFRSDFDGAQWSYWRTIYFHPSTTLNLPPVIETPPEGTALFLPGKVGVKVQHDAKYDVTYRVQWRPNAQTPWPTGYALWPLQDQQKSGNTSTGNFEFNKLGEWRFAFSCKFNGAPWSEWRTVKVVQYMKIQPINHL